MFRLAVLVACSSLLACVSALGGSEYIVGGSPAVDGQWPWQAGLWLNGQFRCGATLIHPNWILTSGYCVDATGTWVAELGNVIRGSGTQISITSATKHPEYNIGSGSYPNDIAVARLATPADTTNPNIKTVPIPPVTGIDWTAYTCYTTGWGRNCSTCDYYPVLQQANLPVVTDDVCTSRWSDYYNRVNHTCVWDALYQDKIPCNGDEGTPLSCDYQGVWHVVGVGSWGSATCDPAQPFVSTLTEGYKSWICTATGGEVC